MKRLLTLALAGLLLGGCAGPTKFLMDVEHFEEKDLRAAVTDAVIHKDAPAAMCYMTLLDIILNDLPNQPLPSAPVGPVSAFQAVRDVAKAAQQGPGTSPLAQKVNLGCAALFNDANADALRLGAKFRP